ncbi:uncharacterized protein LOC6527873 isoform X1 [Drosophila yakuba]|uniref:Uncharacterized protein, isoform A n=1 Tax=Drosophila yakuba TaxID=7245 RepID=B4NY55_DROYA|nr:uncharacterized protein LOC6527873 isoform X1 [Drosophila yakuba]EDW88657.1 uncharacterized protein Dyak_GE10468, isoform A [Drosophila yakuba]
MRVCRPKKCIVDYRIIAIRRRRSLIRMLALGGLLMGQTRGIPNQGTPNSIETLGPASLRRRNRRRRMQLRARRPLGAISMPSLRHPGQGARLHRNNPLWGRANILTTPCALVALNELALGNHESSSVLVMAHYLNRRFHFTLAPREEPPNENPGVQNPDVQDGNGQNLYADENNNMQGQNSEVPEANVPNGQDALQEEHEDAHDQNQYNNEE